ncbi:MAG: hypothetical protein ACT4PT_03390 [Methanobacteriota archaeon]
MIDGAALSTNLGLGDAPGDLGYIEIAFRTVLVYLAGVIVLKLG